MSDKIQVLADERPMLAVTFFQRIQGRGPLGVMLFSFLTSSS